MSAQAFSLRPDIGTRNKVGSLVNLSEQSIDNCKALELLEKQYAVLYAISKQPSNEETVAHQ